MAKGKTILIKYYRSRIGRPERQKKILRSLGLKKLNQVVEHRDNPGMRGAVAKIPHLIKIIEGEEK